MTASSANENARFDLQTRCIKCSSFRYFDINGHGIFEPDWICGQCLPAEYQRLKSAYDELIRGLADNIARDAAVIASVQAPGVSDDPEEAAQALDTQS